MNAVEVSPLLVGDATAAGRLLAASHGEYPAFRQLFPDPAVRVRVLRPFLTTAARDTARNGHGLVARVDHGLVGVALWMPPGRFPPSPLRKARMAPALARAASTARGGFPRFARTGAALERSLPDRPGWYLQALGVHPGAQRRGVGTALLAAGLTAVGRTGLPCHLHTSDPANVDYYRRWGFELTRPAIRTGPAGPAYFGMSRSAAGSAAKGS